jgi:hypothetical protein
MAGLSRWNHDRIIRHSAIKNGNSQPEHGKPITLAEATQCWDAAARDKIQGAVDAYEEMQKERCNKRQARRSRLFGFRRSSAQNGDQAQA